MKTTPLTKVYEVARLTVALRHRVQYTGSFKPMFEERRPLHDPPEPIRGLKFSKDFLASAATELLDAGAGHNRN